MRIFILLTDTRTLFSRSIKLYTKRPYNHVSIAFDKALTEVYSFGRKTANNPFTAGFIKERIEHDLLKNADCAIYSCEVTDEQHLQMLQKIREMEAQKEVYHYNLLGILALVARIELKRKNAYFCSQFVATILREANIFIRNKPTCFVTPADIQDDFRMQLEYEGTIKQYPLLQKSDRLRTATPKIASKKLGACI